jgi:hypothetical protein
MGFSAVLPTHMKKSKVYKKSTGLIAKLPGLLLPLARSEQGGGGGLSG